MAERGGDSARRGAGAPGLGRTLGRIALGAALVFAGTSHLTFARDSFQAQVPTWLPLDADFVVLASGIVEITLGLALLFLRRYRVQVGWVVALFFLAVFPGNISQFVTGTSAFGLETDVARGIRLLFQPVLVAWALWATGAWSAWRAARRGRASGTGDGAERRDPDDAGLRRDPDDDDDDQRQRLRAG